MNLNEFITQAWDKLTGVDAKLEAMAANTAPLADENEQLKVQITELEGKLEAAKEATLKTIDEYETRIQGLGEALTNKESEAANEILKKETEVDERAAAKAAEVLAQQGADLEGEEAPAVESRSGSLWDQYHELEGEKKVEFYQTNKAALFAEFRASKQG